MFKKSLVATFVSSAMLLTACGGGSGGSSSNNNVSTPNPSPEQPTDSDNPTDKPIVDEPSTPTVTPISNELLANDTALPPYPENSNPLPVLKDKATMDALKEGIYNRDMVKVYSTSYFQSDCDDKILCPSITKHKYDSSKNEIISRSWAYMPIQKKWIELSSSTPFNTFPESNYYLIDSTSWLSDEVDFRTPESLVNNQLNYSIGSVNYEVSGAEYNLANKNFNSTISNEPAVYSSQAKRYQFYTIFQDELLVFDQTIDAVEPNTSTYDSLAQYRDAHSNQSNPTCFNQQDFITFQPQSLGGSRFYNSNYECDITNFDANMKVEDFSEGLKTHGNTKVLYLENHHTPDGFTSSYQYLWAITLDGAGSPIYGKALQPQYAYYDDEEYFNKVAIIDWLKTGFNESEALSIPE